MSDDKSRRELEAEISALRAQLAALQAQHDYERTFRRAMENIGAVFYVTDLARQKVQYVSPAYAHIWGQSTETLYADITTFVTAIEEQYRPLVFGALECQLRGEATETEYRVVRPDGSSSWIRDRAFPVRDEQGNTSLVTGIAEDITGAKEIETRLRAADLRYRDLFENAPVMYALTEVATDGPVIFDCNVPFCAALGYSRDQVIGRPLADFYTPESATKMLETGFMASLEHEVFAVERTLVTAEGEEIPCLLQAGPRYDDAGQIVGTRAAFINIGDRKQAEQALAASEANFRSLVESSNSVIAVVDRTGTIFYVNPTGAALLPDTSIIGRTIDDVYPPDPIHGSLAPAIRQMIDAQVGQTFEVSSVTPLGNFWFSVTVTPLRNDAGTIDRAMVIASDITTSKTAELALVESESRFRSLFEHSPVAYQSLDDQGRIIDANERMCSLLGYNADELLGTWFGDLWAPELRERFPSGFARFREAGAIQQDLRLCKKDGNIIEVELDGRIQRDAGGNFVRTHCVLYDITERKHAEEALRESEDKYRSLIESSEAGIAIIHGDGTYLFLNQIAASILGGTPDSLTGRSMYDLFPADAAQAQGQSIRQVIESETGIVVEAPTTVAAGVRWYRTSVQPLRSATGVVDRVMINTIDITERKEAEQLLETRVRERTAEIQRLSSLHRAILENAGLAILSTDAAGIIQTFNPEAERLLGYKAHEVIGVCSPAHFYLSEELGRPGPRSGGAPTSDLFTPAFQNGHEPQESTFVRKDGTQIPVLHTVSVLRDEHGSVTGSVSLAADISLRKQSEKVLMESEETLRIANAELARANRAKDEFLASMSHELRTPLNNIAVLSEILLEQLRGPLNERQAKSVQSIDNSARHLLALINDVLDIAKIEADKIELSMEPVAVLNACQSSLAFVREMAQKKGITLDYPALPADLLIIADERRLKQILVNLLNNAVKFTHAGGRVGLQVRTDPTAGTLRFLVEDTGIGVAAADLTRIFAPFSQVDSSLTRQHEGTGLGLALVKQLVDLHGGSVAVASTPGVGSVFTVTLPWKPAPPRQVDTAPPAVADAQVRSEGSRGVILLADDNELNTESLGEYLELSGYEVVIARDGAEALAKAEATNPTLILMDIQMPAMDGLEAMRRLRADERFATTPIIALTALAMTGDRERCLAAGATEYMSKPLSPRLVVETIRRLLDSQ